MGNVYIDYCLRLAKKKKKPKETNKQKIKNKATKKKRGKLSQFSV